MTQAKSSGINRVLIAIYAVLALAALGRSTFELVVKFNEAPLPYSLSALAAVVYLVVTFAMIRRARKLAIFMLALELVFVLVVGFAGLIDASLFPQKTVWTSFGIGYAFFPLFMPIVGLVYLVRKGEH